MQLLSDYFAQQNNNYNNRYTDTHPDKMAYNARYNETNHYINNWHLVTGATWSDLLLQLFRSSISFVTCLCVTCHNILCVSAVCTVSATKAVRCLWLVNWNSYEPAQPITEADSLGSRQSVYISIHTLLKQQTLCTVSRREIGSLTQLS